MTTWTKELPKEEGWFWYREVGSNEAEPALFQWRGDEKAALPYLWRLAPKEPLGGMFYAAIDGEFWPKRLPPPPEQEQTITVTADMRDKIVSKPPTRWPSTSINFPPPPIKVELDPNHPHA